MDTSNNRSPIARITLIAALALFRDRGYTVDLPSLTPGIGRTLNGAGRVHRDDGTFNDEWTARLTEICGVLVISVRVGSDPIMDATVRLDASFDVLEPLELRGYATRHRPGRATTTG